MQNPRWDMRMNTGYDIVQNFLAALQKVKESQEKDNRSLRKTYKTVNDTFSKISESSISFLKVILNIASFLQLFIYPFKTVL